MRILLLKYEPFAKKKRFGNCFWFRFQWVHNFNVCCCVLFLLYILLFFTLSLSRSLTLSVYFSYIFLFYFIACEYICVFVIFSELWCCFNVISCVFLSSSFVQFGSPWMLLLTNVYTREEFVCIRMCSFIFVASSKMRCELVICFRFWRLWIYDLLCANWNGMQWQQNYRRYHQATIILC